MQKSQFLSQFLEPVIALPQRSILPAKLLPGGMRGCYIFYQKARKYIYPIPAKHDWVTSFNMFAAAILFVLLAMTFTAEGNYFYISSPYTYTFLILLIFLISINGKVKKG